MQGLESLNVSYEIEIKKLQDNNENKIKEIDLLKTQLGKTI